MSAFITNIRQNTDYYYKKAMQSFEKLDILGSIKYLNEAEKLASTNEKYEIYFIQGMMYAKLEMYERSTEYFLMSTFSLPLQTKAFIGIFENMLALEKLDIADSYKTMLSYHPGIKKEELADINAKFDKACEHFSPKLRIATIEDIPTFTDDYSKAIDYMCDCYYEEALDILQKYDPKESPKTRDIVTNCLILLGRYEEAEKVAFEGKLNTEDKCNLILCYYLIEENDKKTALINELYNNKKLSKEEMFRFAVRLAKIGENLKSILMFEKYFEKEPYDDYANIIYCRVCMDTGLFSKAKNSLIKFFPVALFDSGIYDELLKKCEAQQPANYINNVDPWSVVDKKYKSRIEYLNNLSDEDFEINASKYKNEVLWLATAKDKYLRNTFFTRYCTLQESDDIINKMLVCDDVDNKTKRIIIDKRLDSGINKNIMFTRNEMFLGFIKLSDNLANNKLYHKAYTLLIKRVLDSNQQGLFDFGYFVKRAERLYGDRIEDPYILAAVISWDIDKNIKRKTIKSICNYYGIREEDFWKYYKEE